MAEIEAGQRPAVMHVGSLTGTRDFTDVRDMMRAFYLAATLGEPGELYNLGSGEGRTIASALDMLLSLATCPIRVEQDPARLRPSDLPRLVCDASKFRALCDGNPRSRSRRPSAIFSRIGALAWRQASRRGQIVPGAPARHACSPGSPQTLHRNDRHRALSLLQRRGHENRAKPSARLCDRATLRPHHATGHEAWNLGLPRGAGCVAPGGQAMRVLITGITGMVGSHLAELLLDRGGVERYGTYRWRSRMDNIVHIQPRLHLVECDLVDAWSTQRAIEQVRPDRIFHLAAQSFVPMSWAAPSATLHTNIIGQTNLLEAVRKVGLDPLIHVAGSSEEYGLVLPHETPIKETNPLRPLSPYAVSKVGQEMLALSTTRATACASW